MPFKDYSELEKKDGDQKVAQREETSLFLQAKQSEGEKTGTAFKLDVLKTEK